MRPFSDSMLPAFFFNSACAHRTAALPPTILAKGGGKRPALSVKGVLFRVVSVQESHNLAAGAVRRRAKGRVAGTVGDFSATAHCTASA